MLEQDMTPDTDAAPAATESTEPNPPAWYDGIADETIRRWAQAKGWKDPLAAVESNYNLERLMGNERAGRLISLPGENASAEELRAFRSRLGVPDTPEGYALPLPQGVPDDFARSASQWLHEAGVPARAASLLAERWNTHLEQSQAQAARQQAAASAAQAAESAAQLDALRSEWGTQYEANAEHAHRAAVHFLPAPDAAAREALTAQLKGALGPAAYYRFMSRIGKGLAEHVLVSGDSPAGAHTPEAARARIAQLREDKAWSLAYVSGDAAKVAEMSRLHQVGFGEGR